MSGETTCPRVLRDALFGPRGGEEQISRHLLGDTAVMAALAAAVVVAPGGRTMVVQEITRAVTGLLSIDVVDVVLGGWKRQHDLRAAARRTMADPDETELVKLATHVISLTEDPSVDVVVDGEPALTVRVHISVSATVDGLVAVVQRGLLTRLQSGTVLVTGRVKIRDTTVAERSCTLDAEVDVPLGDGVALLASAEVTPARTRVHTVHASG